MVAIIVAAGRGERLGGETPKAFIDIAGKSLLRRSAEALARSGEIGALIVVAPPGFEDQARAEAASTGKLRAVVPGGDTRQESVRAGLRKTAPRDRVVLVHDAARPFVDADVIARVIQGVRTHGAAIPIAPVVDTIKLIQGDRIGETVNRDSLGAAQTPQGFDRAALMGAYARAARAGVALTDEAMAMERQSHPVAAVEGSPRNFKITTKDDLDRARLLLAPAQPLTRVGQGFDIHRLVPRKRLMLGGVHVPAAVGLEGHSDGDVLLHALCDALLGASGLGEIGSLFPSSDRSLRGAPSSRFVSEVMVRLARAHLSIVNVDATLIAERPRLSGHLMAMKDNIASLLQVEPGQVSIKVKSADTLGAIGRGEGIAAQVLALLLRS
ncbi:MAG: 2-C-methyl-D-erythritol 4-phosphate cytidylyltransferase [Vicinamibacteria bacterium]|nr:2-C-methyl-D-erythritol 4-phosphate cytidylyltransferase [Vicinamibacteria bacterium]